MKLAIALITLATPVVAYRPEVVRDENGVRRLKNVPIEMEEELLPRRLVERQLPVAKETAAPGAEKVGYYNGGKKGAAEVGYYDGGKKGGAEGGKKGAAKVGYYDGGKKGGAEGGKKGAAEVGAKKGAYSAKKGKGDSPGTDTPEDESVAKLSERYCKTWHMLAKLSEIEDGTKTNSVGSTMDFPIYFGENNVDENNSSIPYLTLAGSFIDATTNIDETGNDCVFEGSFLFGEPEKDTGLYNNQLTLAGTCSGTANAIIGGSGDFSCAVGYEYFDNESPDGYVSFTAYYCSGCDSKTWS